MTASRWSAPPSLVVEPELEPLSLESEPESLPLLESDPLLLDVSPVVVPYPPPTSSKHGPTEASESSESSEDSEVPGSEPTPDIDDELVPPVPPLPSFPP